MFVVEKDIVIGSRVEELIYALENDKFLILNGNPPEAYEFLHEDSTAQFWSYLYWELFFRNSILGVKPRMVRLIPDLRQIKIISTSGAEFRLRHTKDVLFSSIENVELESIEATEELLCYEVVDMFEVNSGSKHDMWEILSPKDDLVRKIVFFISERIDGNKDRKDLVSYSYLSEKQLNEFEYSDTMARFKTESALQQNLAQKSKIKLKHVSRRVAKKIEFKINSGVYNFVKKIKLKEVSKAKYERYRQFYLREKEQ